MEFIVKNVFREKIDVPDDKIEDITSRKIIPGTKVEDDVRDTVLEYMENEMASRNVSLTRELNAGLVVVREDT